MLAAARVGVVLLQVVEVEVQAVLELLLAVVLAGLLLQVIIVNLLVVLVGVHITLLLTRFWRSW
jgi:hypothetical protein